ncbi:MAG: hypothetical protein A2Y03_08775 [Omnitrophica WOR_2 bacterium GWF2_38_59]|nr:MAG: hypothetical protein A2Y03_08775 [Omnitrophica WOR_2 bacterium GWF2_38_59]OGX46716.1 MAG: hypothetical protein A2243_02405 [Omnitrophica WOR_2 bacterium RIFOXYA2_FULL_38_17]OGX56587.1 MAG: hypothetical protein A2447_07080 [Omnitrophica WOR_2 bacterium RIFOXYC2_FULL_38_12]OGX59806.1 MAG: hypothetical protein A2306_05930 [Omnitrophica WOR_2 bacterium RIFOXYB2_FULL_38_16]HBG62135.1 DUF502 domain-containing protein [Candidatus Omnitrophota bacterium]
MLKKIKNYFLSGLVVFLPLALTVYLIFLAMNFAEGIFGKFLKPIFAENFGFYFSGLSIIMGVYVIVVIGFLVTHFIGKKVYDFFENLLIKVPIVKQIYPALKEMVVFLFTRDRMGSFGKVVIAEYPRKGMYALGFLTNESAEKISRLTGKELCNVFIPSAPGPLTGYVTLIPKKEIILTDISIEEAFKFIVSGGVVNPI